MLLNHDQSCVFLCWFGGACRSSMSYNRRVGCRCVEALVGKMLVLVQPAVDVVCIGERDGSWMRSERRRRRAVGLVETTVLVAQESLTTWTGLKPCRGVGKVSPCQRESRGKPCRLWCMGCRMQFPRKAREGVAFSSVGSRGEKKISLEGLVVQSCRADKDVGGGREMTSGSARCWRRRWTPSLAVVSRWEIT